ncbi:peptidoglycan-binding domain-containing protein [Marinobacter persicus]|uniref:Peptidoglycan binding protein n=1 Tax=Marinobacter persicus TaxID=930118 RepID=A0A2S6G346_9GAMM|nr:peptidoglycan-binding domain-containing protein [Marinobacter persicus]KXS54388.1 MAG: Uncharacterized protein AWU57_1221 [Marinobacter sp. T13-3]PPK50233.1 putative peptidoglycan binding protein [Marinobacter persicus]PPK52858.1 putative peptidoglycan binding protein [Marinobacter persicus]PPK56721.1 putative peptidoglycan binding protein [Marinobacter persicus]
MVPMVKHGGWLKLLLVLLVLEVAYVLAEFSFNASILNAASGALGTGIELDHLTIKGKQLSGVGLGLLIFAFVALRGTNPPRPSRLLVGSALLFPGCIWAMTTFQTWLINGPIVDAASNEELVAAHYLQNAVPAIRDGLIGIKGVPINREDLPRPETKAFLTLIGPTLLHNDQAVAKVVDTAHELIKNRVQQEALRAADDLYEVYGEQVGPERVGALYEAYMDGSYQYTVDLQRQMAEIDQWSRKLQRATSRLKGAWARYKHYHKWDGVMWSDYSDVVTTPGLTRNELMAHPKTLKHALGITDPKLLAKIKPHLFTDERVIGGAVILLPRPFMRVVARHEYPKKFREAFYDQIKEETGLEYHDDTLRPHLSRSEFMATPFMNALTRHLISQTATDMDYDLSANSTVRPGMSKDAFVNEVVIPAAWEQADRLFGSLPEPGTTLNRGNPEHTAPLKALYVPALALTFSLIFSVLTLGKIANRLAMIWLTWNKPGRMVGPARLLIPVGTLVALVSLPVLIGSNRLAQTEIIEAAAGKSESLGVPASILRWTMDVEPLIFPLGNKAMQVFSVSWLNFAQYHDENATARDVGSNKQTVQVIDLKAALSIVELQRTLGRKGYDPGPIDGILGPATTNAVRAFQEDHGLAITGTQNRETIKALRD